MTRHDTFLLLLTTMLACGSTPKSGGDKTPPVQPTPAPEPAPPQIAACTSMPAKASMFPSDRCCDTNIAAKLVSTDWAEHDDGPVYDTFDGRGWFRDHRVSFKPTKSGLAMTLETKGGDLTKDSRIATEWLTDADAAAKHWSTPDVERQVVDCSICGELLECGGKLTTVRIEDGWLRFNDPVTLADGSLYTIHNQQEVIVKFDGDPTSDAGGAATVTTYGSPKSGSFTSEASEVHGWVTLGGSFVRQGKRGPDGRQVNVDGADLYLWLELHANDVWVMGLTGGYDFPLPYKMRDLARYPIGE